MPRKIRRLTTNSIVNMKTIKIFLASSEELTDDRYAFGNLVRRLDKIYEKRGIRIELFEWEDYDAAYNNRRKQDEYNDQIKASDMFLALFHTKAGKFTIEEFDVATEEFKKKTSPKVYTYCKDLQENEVESPELAEFKERLFNEMGHYWSRYNNRDSMQLHFVMQLQLVETSGAVEKLKLEEGTVMLEGMPIARIDNLQFAIGNETYKKMDSELTEMPEDIETLRLMVQAQPDNQKYKDLLQKKLDKYNQLKKEFDLLQKNLFETALRITVMQQQQVSKTLCRAIDAFEEGNLERANTLLNEIAHEAENHIVQLDLQRSLIHQDIEALLLQARILLSDIKIPINKRIEQVSAIYSKADNWAEKSALEKSKYAAFLFDYAIFLYDYALYDKALTIWEKQISMSEDVHGSHSVITARSYHNIARVYGCLGRFKEEMDYYSKALTIRECLLGTNHPDTASSYNNIGCCYEDQQEFPKALEFFSKALEIRLKVLGEKHLYTATSYNNIGEIYYIQKSYDIALNNFYIALHILEETVGENHPYTATLYQNIGKVYEDIENYADSVSNLNKSIIISEKVLGLLHPDTALAYSNIGDVCVKQGDYSKAIEHYKRAMIVYKRTPNVHYAKIAEINNKIETVEKMMQ